MTEVDICIISFAKTDELKRVTERGIESVLQSDDNVKFNVIVVESNENVEYDFPNTTTLHTWLPFKYNSYLNFARKHGKAPFVCLCNNDLTYEKNWASNIIREMEKNPALMSASPFCPQTQKQSYFIASNVYYGYQVRRHVAGWCIFQKREIYNTIKDLDESVDFWYSDNLYADQLIFNDIKHALIVNSIVNHHEKDLGVTGRTTLGTKIYDFTSGQGQKYIEARKKYLKLRVING